MNFGRMHPPNSFRSAINLNQTRNFNAPSLSASPGSVSTGGSVSAVGEKKKFRVQYIQSTASLNHPANCHIQIHPKAWPNLRENDILEISPVTNPQSSSSQYRGGGGINPGSVNLSSSSGGGAHDDDSSPIIFQIVQASFNDTIPSDVIRIDMIAGQAPFSIKQHTFANVVVLEKSTVALDLVELLFKEQYLNGSDMLRIKNHMQNTCVYLKKNIEFCGMKCSVREIWAPRGDIVTCGYIGEKTRLVFRSQSAMCTIYIQMSREMWEFDVNGEMYHEKAVNFLSELFTNWRAQTCQHDVTIALFSRIFYEAKSIDDFPKSTRACIKKDHKNRWYEDFYRVVYQNECYEDWMTTLTILKRLIKEYRDYILNYHRRQLVQSGLADPSLPMPVGRLSSAAEGNFLETLNLSSSVFERHFIDRPFDRTGMMSLVITAGNGVFEVSRELSKVTKERVIDNGIGSDLVCLGEQPLHAVPLFKYDEGKESYNIPHWINLSFYTSSETVRYCNSKFLPRAKIKVDKSAGANKPISPETILPNYSTDKSNYMRAFEETDNMFECLSANPKGQQSQANESVNLGTTKRAPSRVGTSQNIQVPAQVIASTTELLAKKPHASASTSSINTVLSRSRREGNDSVTTAATSTTTKRVHADSTDMTTMATNDDSNDDDIDDSSVELDSESEQSVPNEIKRLRKKEPINPFKEGAHKLRMTFERRRWAHIFPLENDGTPIFQHRVRVKDENESSQSAASTAATASKKANPSISVPSNSNSTAQTPTAMSSMEMAVKLSPDSVGARRDKNTSNMQLIDGIRQNRAGNTITNANMDHRNGAFNFKKSLMNNNYHTYSTADRELNTDESTQTMVTGVAWKSLTIPSCLPLTTDFCPKKETWNAYFVRSSDYDLLLDDIREQYGYSGYQYDKTSSMANVFQELVGHRLAMGFQMVVPKGTFTYPSKQNPASSNNNGGGGGSVSNVTEQGGAPAVLGPASASHSFICDLSSSTSVIPRNMMSFIKNYYKLSFGRIYHELFYMVDPATKSDWIKVEIYIPKKSITTKSMPYIYRFQVPDSKKYDISHCEICRKNIESVKWNLIDSYICIQGNGSLTPSELQKCWRQRIYLIPIMYVQNRNAASVAASKPSSSLNNSSSSFLTPQNTPTQNSNNNVCSSSSSSIATITAATSASSTGANLPPPTAAAAKEPVMVTNLISQQKQPLIHCDIYQRKSVEELRFTRDYYFIKFMEMLNKLNRPDDRRVFSKATLKYIENANSMGYQDAIIAVQAVMNQNSASQSSSQSNAWTAASIASSRSQISLNNKTMMPHKLPSPKTHVYPKLLKYLSLRGSENKNASAATRPNNRAAHFGQIPAAAANTAPNNTTTMDASVTAVQNDALRSEIYSYLNSEYKIHMLNYVPFIENKNDIPANCFLSAEAVWWCTHNITDIENEADAIVFMQVMVDFDLIRHISPLQKVFVHGFYMYYIITEQNAKHNLYTKDYCEVGYCDIECSREDALAAMSSDTMLTGTSGASGVVGGEQQLLLSSSSSSPETLVSVKNLLPDSAKALPVTGVDMFKSYMNLYAQYSKTEFGSISPDAILKLVNVDVDPQRKSNRVEWASAVYRSHYHPLCSFELEIQWEIATGQLLSELVSYWAKASNKFNYHIVPAPIDPFAMPIVENSDPLRGPIYVKLNISCLLQNESSLFENIIESKYKFPGGAGKNSSCSSGESPSSVLTTVAAADSSTAPSLSLNTSISNNKSFYVDNNAEFRQYLEKKYPDVPMEQLVEEGEFVEREFKDFVERERIMRLQYFQEAILEKFGFVRNSSVVKTLLSDDDQTFFIHSSGGMFVLVPNYYANYMIRTQNNPSVSKLNQSGYSTAMKPSGSSGPQRQSSFFAHQKMMQARDKDARSVNDVSEKLDNISANMIAGSPTSSSTYTDSGFANSMLVKSSTEQQANKNGGGANSSFNSSLSTSFVSSSNMVGGGGGGGGGGAAAPAVTRERSHTKSQHIQFLKLNDAGYLNNPSSSVDSTSEPKAHDLRQSIKLNEKLDLIQLQQREHMLLLSTDLNESNDSSGGGGNGDPLLFGGGSGSRQHNDSLSKTSNTSSVSSTSQTNINEIESPNTSFLSHQQHQSNVSSSGVHHHHHHHQQQANKVPFYADQETFIGFLWSWNFMLGKRWRSQFTGEDTFQDNTLADFILFCSNQDGRLQKFYRESISNLI